MNRNGASPTTVTEWVALTFFAFAMVALLTLTVYSLVTFQFLLAAMFSAYSLVLAILTYVVLIAGDARRDR